MSPEKWQKFKKTLLYVIVAAIAIIAPGFALLALLVWFGYKGIRKLLDRDRPAEPVRPSYDPDLDSSARSQNRAAQNPAGRPSWDPEAPEKPKKRGGILEGVMVVTGAAVGLVVIRLAILGLMVIVVFFGLFTACTDHPYHHSRREVVRYLKEEYPGEDIEVARRAYAGVDRDGDENDSEVWDCWFEDLPDAVFHATSYRMNGGPIPVWGYGLSDDAMVEIRNYYIDAYTETGKSLDAWTWEYGFEMDFRSMADAETAGAQIAAFYDYYTAQPHAQTTSSLWCSIGDMPYPTHVLRDHFEFVDPYESENIQEDIEAACETILKDYYTFYRVSSPDFTEEELAEYAEKTWWCWDGVVYTEERERVHDSIFDGIGLMSNGGTKLPYLLISYGGLYELLQRLELDPESPTGEPGDFVVTGADGRTYGFSYEHPNLVDGEPCWPAVVDGKPVECSHFTASDCAPAIQLSSELFRNLTGLTVEEW